MRIFTIVELTVSTIALAGGSKATIPSYCHGDTNVTKDEIKGSLDDARELWSRLAGESSNMSKSNSTLDQLESVINQLNETSSLMNCLDDVQKAELDTSGITLVALLVSDAPEYFALPRDNGKLYTSDAVGSVDEVHIPTSTQYFAMGVGVNDSSMSLSHIDRAYGVPYGVPYGMPYPPQQPNPQQQPQPVYIQPPPQQPQQQQSPQDDQQPQPVYVQPEPIYVQPQPAPQQPGLQPQQPNPPPYAGATPIASSIAHIPAPSLSDQYGDPILRFAERIVETVLLQLEVVGTVFRRGGSRDTALFSDVDSAGKLFKSYASRLHG